MEKEIIDMRELMKMIKEKKGMDATLAMEFDCKIEVDNIEPLMYNSADPQHRVAVNWKAFGVGRGAPALIPDRR